MKKVKLFTRYNQVNFIFISLLFILSGWGSLLLINRVILDAIDRSLYEHQQQIKDYVKIHGTLPQVSELDAVKVTYKEINAGEARLNHYYEPQKITIAKVARWKKFRQLLFMQRAGQKMYVVTVANRLNRLHGVAVSIMLITVTGLFIALLINLLVNRLMLKRLWQPFYSTIATIRNFRLGRSANLDIPVTAIEEFAYLNQILAERFDLAEKDYYTLKEFTENAAHELQTPLAIVRSQLDLLTQDQSLTQERSEILQKAYRAIKQLTRLNKALLLLAKIENHQFESSKQLDLKAMITVKLADLHELLANRNMEVTTLLAPAGINASEELVDILLNNLLSNAVRHNVYGGEIEITLNQHMLSISNMGINEPLDKNKVFKRFYKSSPESYHNGLGLAIAWQICEFIGASIIYKFEQDRHHFILRWPQS